jgi:SET domain-containing protein
MRQRKWHKALLYLGPSKIHGIGCFSDTGIKKGEFVRVWSPEDSRWVPLKKAHASPHKKLFQRFGIRTTGGYWAPIDFLRISVGWYMNHSEMPNLQSDDGDVTYYALRDIEPGEEVTIDYRRMDDAHDNLARDDVLPGRQRKQAAKPTLKRRPSGPPASDRPQARQPSRAAPPGHD